ncbi:MAG: HD domain-containing phosphohydrolase [Alphaproteobacteria bacterium]
MARSATHIPLESNVDVTALDIPHPPVASVVVPNGQQLKKSDSSERRLEQLIEIGIALSSEHSHERLLERILEEAMVVGSADGGTLYVVEEGHENELRFVIVRNVSLGLAFGGTSGNPIAFPPLRLHDVNTGAPNYANVATASALSKRIINISDAYTTAGFDFSGTRKFDAQTGYRSVSFLTVPLLNTRKELVGVLQLINSRDAAGAVVPFQSEIERLVSALSSQAATALENNKLFQQQKKLLESFIEVIARAIDAKSPYTGGHCQRVPALTKMLTKAACESMTGPFADFNLNEDEWYELHIAAWMHDCGKITTPEYVVDKATKLETIWDRIDLVKLRIEILRRDARITYLEAMAKPGSNSTDLEKTYTARIQELDTHFKFLETINIGSETIADEDLIQLQNVAQQLWIDAVGGQQSLLTENERYNLSVKRGTLTKEEREIINDHIVQTISMLEQLPFPKHLRRVPEYAGGHHEKMDGTGYPKGLTRQQMSIPARVMAIADIFEALTARDRPYKKPKTLSESIRIMTNMKRNHHIDPDLFDLFLNSGIWREYAQQFLLPEQIDEPDIPAALAVKPS